MVPVADRKRAVGRHPYLPESVLPPGETLRETLEALGMNQVELSQRTGLSTKHVNQIIKGIAALSHETAISLERATGVPARFWNALEANYRDYISRANERKELEGHRSWLARLPIKFLRKKGIITAPTSDEPAVMQQALKFFGVANVDAWEATWEKPTADFLQSAAFEIDTAALATWLRLGEIEAIKVKCAAYDRERLRSSLPELRALSTYPAQEFLPRIKRLCSEAGVAVVIVPEVTGCRASGATRWLSPQKAVLQLSVRYKRNDHLWFAFFHELGHILLHGKRDQFVEDSPNGAGASPKEFEANEFAANTLIPATVSYRLAELKTLNSIEAFASEIGVAPGIVVGRMHHDRLLGFNVGHRLFERYELTEVS